MRQSSHLRTWNRICANQVVELDSSELWTDSIPSSFNRRTPLQERDLGDLIDGEEGAR